MPNHTQLRDLAGSASLTFSCGDLPADGAIRAAGYEPNGYFWEGIVRYLAPNLADDLELDSEAGTFSALGSHAALEETRGLIDPYLDDGERVAAVIRKAESAGFQFDD
jgi:hypothetical protein